MAKKYLKSTGELILRTNRKAKGLPEGFILVTLCREETDDQGRIRRVDHHTERWKLEHYTSEDKRFVPAADVAA